MRVSSPTLIGRRRELERLSAALARVRGGGSASVLVRGEAGIGKTRLIASFVASARASGALVLMGGCIDLGDGGIPYAPIVEAIRTWAREVPSADLARVVGPGRDELARLIPELGAARPETPAIPNALSIGFAQGRFFELLLAMLSRLAADSPVALVVEDLHWSDRSTRDLVTYLARNARGLPLLIVLTYRTDALHRRHPLVPFLAEMERLGTCETVTLEPFDRPDLAAMLRAIAGPETDSRLIDSIHARSSGNAFFAEELLVAAKDRTADFPPTLRAVVLARVMELSTEAQELLRVASAGGQRIDAALLRAATGMTEVTQYAALRETVERQILVPDDRSVEERYAFRHALLQEAVYDDLLPGERVRLHAAFARTLEDAATAEPALRHDPTHASELAYHWYAAHDLPRAFEAALRAARTAEGGYAFPEALAWYERALGLWDQVPEAVAAQGADPVETQTAAAAAARFSDPDRSVAHLTAALALVDPAADPVRAATLYVRLGRAEWIGGHGDLALQAHRTAVRLVPPGSPPEARARALAGLAQILNLQDRYAEARPLADEAVALAEASAARQVEGHARNSRAVARSQDGEIDEAMQDLRDALAIAEAIADVEDIGRAYTNLVFVLKQGGRAAEAIEVATQAVAIARRLGFLAFLGTHLLCNAADLLFGLGRWAESDTAIRQVELIGAFGLNEILARELGARLALVRGRLDDAEVELWAVAPRAARTMDRQCIVPVQSSLAELALWRRQPDQALRAALEGIDLVGHGSFSSVVPLLALALRACADLASQARSRRADADLAEVIDRGEAIRSAVVARVTAMNARSSSAPPVAAWIASCEAEASRLRGRSDAEVWADAVVAWQRVGNPYATAYARFRQAEALITVHGDRLQAGHALAAAVEAAGALGATPLLEEAEALARRARMELPGGTGTDDRADSAPLGLSAREREVLALVALGLTNRQIGQRLFISDKTASVHVSNILRKLGVEGRAEAAVIAHRSGLV
jgi:DNA-binding CsgD family transcriptional regulator/tetratricopeptide (TPR) repeat protein